MGNYSIPVIDMGQPLVQAPPSAEVYHLGGGTDYPMASSSATALDAFEQDPQHRAMNNFTADPLLPGGDVYHTMAMMGFLYPSVDLGSAWEDPCMPSVGYTL